MSVDDKADINRQSFSLYGYTALHNACELENKEIVKFLLQNGADTKIKSNMLYTPLHVSLINRQQEVARLLIVTDDSVINEYSKEKSTPLLLAALENFYDIIELLAQLGADVNSEKSEDTPLRIATLKKFYKSVEILLKYGAAVNRIDSHGFTPLFYSITEPQLLKLFLNHRTTHVNAKSLSLVTPLHFAVQNGKYFAVEQLLQHRADVNARDVNNKTPLVYAIAAKEAEIVKLLLDNNANIEDDIGLLYLACANDAPHCLLALIDRGVDVNVKDNDNRSSLYAAVAASELCTKILLLKNSEINIVDNFGFSPLCFAVFFGQISCIEALIKKKVNFAFELENSSMLHLSAGLGDVSTFIFLATIICEINGQDANGRTPLHCVIEKNPGFSVSSIISFMSKWKRKFELQQDYEKLAIELLERGADVTLTNNMGICPIISAAYCNDLKILDLIWRKNKHIDLGLQWQKCFFVVCANNFLQIVEYLFQNDLIEINAKCENFGMTALHYACSKLGCDTIMFLLSNGAEIDIKATDGSTPLHICANLGNLDLVKLLIEKGASVDISNDHGNTSLFVASYGGFLNIVIFLHSKGANINVMDADGDLPLHDAAAKGHLSIVEYLVLNGGITTQKNKNNKIPLDLAKENNHNEVVRFLEQNSF